MFSFSSLYLNDGSEQNSINIDTSFVQHTPQHDNDNCYSPRFIHIVRSEHPQMCTNIMNPHLCTGPSTCATFITAVSQFNNIRATQQTGSESYLSRAEAADIMIAIKTQSVTIGLDRNRQCPSVRLTNTYKVHTWTLNTAVCVLIFRFRAAKSSQPHRFRQAPTLVGSRQRVRKLVECKSSGIIRNARVWHLNCCRLWQRELCVCDACAFLHA